MSRPGGVVNMVTWIIAPFLRSGSWDAVPDTGLGELWRRRRTEPRSRGISSTLFAGGKGCSPGFHGTACEAPLPVRSGKSRGDRWAEGGREIHWTPAVLLPRLPGAAARNQPATGIPLRVGIRTGEWVAILRLAHQAGLGLAFRVRNRSMDQVMKRIART